MNYLSALLIGIIGGLSLNIFLPAYFWKKRDQNKENLATKKDIEKITKEIEEINSLYRAESEFFDNGSE